jgi:hypothetical protein
MPLLSGSEMLRRYADMEKESSSHRIVTVCISGEIGNREELYDFDFFATKPFIREEITSVFLKGTSKNPGHA